MPRDGHRRRPQRRLTGVWLPILLVLAVLGSAFGSFQYDVPRRLGWGERADSAEVIAPPAGLDLPAYPAPRAVADPLVAATVDPVAVKKALAPLLRDPDLGPHVAMLVADARGDAVFRGGTSPDKMSVRPASTLKLVTGAAALESLGPATRFRTRVVAGADAKRIVLIGGGDPYLAAKPLPRKTAEVDRLLAPADLRTLARRTAKALRAQGTTTVHLGFDDTLFSGPTVSPHWDRYDVADGYATPITALWADQGLQADGFGSEADPSLAAARTFARELGAAGVKVASAPQRVAAKAGATELAGMDSARVDQIVSEVLKVSDNEGADVLSRHLGVKEGTGATFAGGIKATRAVLARAEHPLAPTDVVLDGSGLSPKNKVSTATLVSMLALAADPAHPELHSLIAGLPVAGFTGSLAERYEEGPVAGRGRVVAKTGTLTGVHALAGVATTPDGVTLLFAVVADRVAVEDGLDARQALDVITSTLGACRCAAAPAPVVTTAP